MVHQKNIGGDALIVDINIDLPFVVELNLELIVLNAMEKKAGDFEWQMYSL